VSQGRAWHTPPAREVGKGAKPETSTAAQGGSSKNKNKNKKKKKASGNNQPLARAPTVVVAAAAMGGSRGPRGDKHPRQAFDNDGRGAHCLVHNSTRHSVEEGSEIKKHMAQYREQLKQQHNDSAPSHH
jgi:hypothetical protein